MNRTGSRSLSLKMILISTVTLLLAVTAICFAVPDGDVDGDGRVTGADALKILRAVVGLDPVTPRMLAHGDVAPRGLDGKPQPDGIISIADALIILQKSIGLVYWDSSFTPPHITSSAPLTATGSQPYRYQVVAVITDGLTATYALTKAPAGMAIDGAKGSITWTPGSAQTGNFDVTVTVTDSNGDSGRQSFVLQVKDGTPPTVRMTAPTQALPGTPVLITATAADNVGVSAVTFFLDGVQQSVVSAPPYQFTLVVPTAALPGTAFTVKATAADAAGNTASTDARITVSALPTSVTISSSPVLAVADNQSYRYQVTTVLSPGMTAKYALTESPSGMTINAVTGLITWAPRSNQDGIYPVTVNVTDTNGAAARQSYVLQVTDGTPPVVQVATSAQALPGSRCNVSATAADNVAVKSVTFFIDGVQQSAFTAAPYQFDLLVPATAAPGSIMVVKAVAVDPSGNSSSAEARITVATPPTVVTITSQPPLKTFDNHPYRYQVGVTLSPAMTAFYSLETAPTGMTIDSATGLITWMPGTDQIGNRQVTIKVTDSTGQFARQPYTLQVVDGTPPTVRLVAPTQALPGSHFTVSAVAADNVGVASVTLYLNGVPQKMMSTAPYQFDLTVPDVASLGSNLTVKAVAVDGAGNSAAAEAQVTVASYLDSQKPTVTLNAPAKARPDSDVTFSAGASDNVGVAGVTFLVNGVSLTQVVAPPYLATYHVPADVSGTNLTITARAVDFSGNTQDATATVVIAADVTTPLPVVTLTAPSSVSVGGTLSLTATVTDPAGVAEVNFTINGTLVATAVLPPYTLDYPLPASVLAGDLLRIEASALDLFGGAAKSTANTAVTAAQVKQAGLAVGAVFDDSKGLPLTGVTAQLLADATGAALNAPVPQVDVDTQGQYVLNGTAGIVFIRLQKPGFTTVERVATIAGNNAVSVPDARLTPFDTQVNSLTTAAGGIAVSSGKSLSLQVPAGALSADTDLRLTAVSGQGLRGFLPTGWSPVAVVEMSPNGLTFGQPATLSAVNSAGLAPGRELTTALYDPATRLWVAGGKAQVAADGKSITASVGATGQVALLLPDPPPTAPPPAVTGNPLAATAAVAWPATPTATGAAVPRSAPPGDSAKSVGQVAVTATQPLPSGTLIRAAVSERYSLNDGNVVVPQPFTQDMVLYTATAADGGRQAAANFPITPSRSYTIQELQQGTVQVDILPPGAPAAGTVIDNTGGITGDTTGDTVTIPPGALNSGTVVSLSPLTAAQLPVTLPAGYQLLQALRLSFPGAALGQSATLAIPRPASLADGTQVLLAQVISDGAGVRRLRLVGVGSLTPDRIIGSAASAGVTFPGVITPGFYLFLTPPAGLGFITGHVTLGVPPLIRSGALVTVDTAPFADVTGAAGAYLVAGAAGTATVTAQDAPSLSSGTGTTTVTAVVSVSLDLALTAATLTVTATSPTAGGRQVALDTAITAQFSAAIDRTTVTPPSCQLQSGGVSVSSALTVAADGRSITLTPIAPLTSATSYTFSLTVAIHDLAGNPLAPFQASFTTVDTSRPVPPPAGQITTTLPDDSGLIQIIGTQGSANPGSAVTATNLRTQETFTVLADDTGQFRIRISAAVGDTLGLTFRNAAGQTQNISITQMVNPDGNTGLGSSGGTVVGASGRSATILSGALATPGIFRLIDTVDSTTLPTLPANFHLVDSFDLTVQGSAFATLQSLTLTQANNRFNPVTSTSYPFTASGTLTVPSDFLVNGSIPFSATAKDLTGHTATTTGSSLVVASSPVSGTTGTRSDLLFPSVSLEAPTQALPGQDLTVTAQAPTARIDFTIPAPASATAGTQYLLGRLIQVNGQPALALVDRLTPATQNGVTVLTTVGRELPGATAGGSYAVVSSDVPLVMATGLATGPTTTVTADSTPFAFVTTTPNGAFTAPVPAGQPFTLTFRDPATGTTRGTATGSAPTSGSTDLGAPLGPIAGIVFQVTVQPGDTAIVDIGDPLLFTFSEPVSGANLTAFIRVTDPAGVRVPGTTTLSSDGLRATFTPLRRWCYATTYRYAVDQTLLAVSGAHLSSTVTGQFTTFTPQLLSTVNPDSIRDVALSGTRAVAAGATGITVLDLTQADTPVKLASVPITGGASGVALLTGAIFTDRNGAAVPAVMALAATGSQSTIGQLRIFDLTTPASPALIGSTQLTTPAGATAPSGVPATPGVPASVAVTAGNSAVIAVQGLGVEAAALTSAIPADTTAPGRALGPRYPAAALESANQVVVLNDKLLVAGAGGLTILDATTLNRLGSIATGGEAVGVAGIAGFRMDVNGDGVIDPATEVFDLAVIANGPDGTVQFYNLSAPANPRLISVVQAPKPAASVTINPDLNLAYVGSGSNGVAIVDLSGPASIQPIDDNHDGVDDRILGVVKTAGTAGRLALNAGSGTALVADGDAGVTTVQFMPPKVTITDVIRDPVAAATGDEQSILDSHVAFTSDDAIQVELTSLVPPRTKLFLAIQEVPNSNGPRLLSFADGTAIAQLDTGANRINVIFNNILSSAGSKVQFRVQNEVGKVIAVFSFEIKVPDVSMLTLQNLIATPSQIVISEMTSKIQLYVMGKFSDGSNINLTSSGSGTIYSAVDGLVALVDKEGSVSAVSGGTTQISITNSNIGTTSTVTINLSPVLKAISASKKYVALDAYGATYQPLVNGIYSDGSLKDISVDAKTSYLSNDINVVKVESNGLISAVGEGFATVVVQYGNFTDHINVSVNYRKLPIVTGIVLQAFSDTYTLDQIYIPASATINGSGILTNVQVNYEITNANYNKSYLSALSSDTGISVANIVKSVSPGVSMVTVSVSDPTTGKVFTDSKTIQVNSASGDNEPNNTLASASNLILDKIITGSVGGQDDPQDVYAVVISSDSTVTVLLNLPPDANQSEFTVVVYAADGYELIRFLPTEFIGAYKVNCQAGLVYVAIVKTGTTISYRLKLTSSPNQIKITSVSPSSGAPGTIVSITGTAFSNNILE